MRFPTRVGDLRPRRTLRETPAIVRSLEHRSLCAGSRMSALASTITESSPLRSTNFKRDLRTDCHSASGIELIAEGTRSSDARNTSFLFSVATLRCHEASSSTAACWVRWQRRISRRPTPTPTASSGQALRSGRSYPSRRDARPEASLRHEESRSKDSRCEIPEKRIGSKGRRARLHKTRQYPIFFGLRHMVSNRRFLFQRWMRDRGSQPSNRLTSIPIIPD